MRAFIDEAGDTGLKTNQGASHFFVVAMVLFEDHEEALLCDQRVSLLRRELRYSESFEFHFRENSDRQWKRFLEAVALYDLQYFVFALNKGSKRLWGPWFEHKMSLYKFTCGYGV